MKAVILVNGKAGVGKDTAVGFMSQAFEQAGFATSQYSCVQPVKAMLSHAGVNTSKKTNADRDLLAAVATALEEHSNVLTTMTQHAIVSLFEVCPNAVCFVHMRKPDWIAHLKGAMRQIYPEVVFETVFIERDEIEHVMSNPADAGVYGMNYDTTIPNNGSITELRSRCKQYVRGLINSYEEVVL
jgi:hypothetical protein